MALQIHKVGELFTASVSPPHSSLEWKTAKPEGIDVVVQKLVELGCHPTDIGDILYSIDPRLIGIEE